MGAYTELVLSCDLKGDMPPEAINTMKWWFREVDKTLSPLIDLTHDPIVASLDYGILETGYPVFNEERQFSLDASYSDIYALNVFTGLKNSGELERFLYWLAPYSETQGFVGYEKCEVGEDPKIIYFFAGKAYLAEVNSQNRVEVTTYLGP